MGEHQTWLDFLDVKYAPQLEKALGRDVQFLMFQENGFSLIHVMFALLVFAFILFGAVMFRTATAGGRSGLVPPPKLGSFRNLFEMLCDAVWSIMVGVMGEKNGRKFFPLIASLAFFILFSNFLALIPGMGVPTTTLKTNLALGILVFVITHFCGLRVHGLPYLKHFFGPIWWLAPLMFPIELISHIVRPISLALRLMGNMVGDHKVVFSFFILVPYVVPVPFLLLGILVSIVQTLVFCLLSMVYISMAIEEHH